MSPSLEALSGTMGFPKPCRVRSQLDVWFTLDHIIRGLSSGLQSIMQTLKKNPAPKWMIQQHVG